jgi:uncharacterized membrane protein YtjA (UPF0391 family)
MSLVRLVRPAACLVVDDTRSAGADRRLIQGETIMLHWAAVFFVIAIIAAVFGFGGIAASAAGVAKILFFAFVIFAVVALLMGRRVSS